MMIPRLSAGGSNLLTKLNILPNYEPYNSGLVKLGSFPRNGSPTREFTKPKQAPSKLTGLLFLKKSGSDYLKGDICLLTFVINGLDGAIGEGDDELA